MTLHDQLRADGWTEHGGATWTRGHLRIAPSTDPTRTGVTLHRRDAPSMTAYAASHWWALHDLMESTHYAEAMAEPVTAP